MATKILPRDVDLDLRHSVNMGAATLVVQHHTAPDGSPRVSFGIDGVPLDQCLNATGGEVLFIVAKAQRQFFTDRDAGARWLWYEVVSLVRERRAERIAA